MGAYYLGEIAHEQYRTLPGPPAREAAGATTSRPRRACSWWRSRATSTPCACNNPEWATAAGFQIGSLYREFYDDLVGAPVPPELTGEAREVYLEEVRKQVKSLLQKAIPIHEKNVLMAERIGENNEWVRRSNEQLDQLKKLLMPGPAAPQRTRFVVPPAEPQHPPCRGRETR